MESNTKRANVARLVTLLATATLMVGATACSSDDSGSSTTTATPATTAAPATTPLFTKVTAATEAPAVTEAPVAPVVVTAGFWIEAVAVPPVAVCMFVSQDGTTLTQGPECNGGLEVELEAVPGCPNGRLSIKGTADTDTPIEGDTAVVAVANGTATVTFTSSDAATVVATSAADPACTYTFENVTPGR
jgi:hypothetical protein